VTVRGWGALALLAAGVALAGGSAGGSSEGGASMGAESSGGIILVVARAEGLGAVVGGTAAQAIASRIDASAVSCGAMFDAQGPVYALRDRAHGVERPSRDTSRGAAVCVVGGRAVMAAGGAIPADATAAVQGYPTMVHGGVVAGLADDTSRTGRVALGILRDGRIALCLYQGGMRAFARELVRVGVMEAVYLDGGRATTVQTRDGSLARVGTEVSQSWVVLNQAEVVRGGVPAGDADLIELPRAYAAAKLDTLARRLIRSPQSWQRWGARWMPGAPVEALVALSITSGGPEERGGPPDFVIGCPNVEAESVRRWRRDGSLRRDLGRDVDPDDAPGYAHDQDAQIYCGLRSYAEHLESAHLPLVEPRPSQWDAWAYRLAAMAYVAGNGAAAAQLAPIASQLATVPRTERWEVLSRAIANTRGSEWGSRSIAGKWKAAHLQLRVDARWIGGLLLAQRMGSPVGWWGTADEMVWLALENRAEVRVG